MREMCAGGPRGTSHGSFPAGKCGAQNEPSKHLLWRRHADPGFQSALSMVSSFPPRLCVSMLLPVAAAPAAEPEAACSK